MASQNTNPNLSILFFNSNSIKGKLDQIKAMNEYYKPDLLSITETKIDSTFDDNELLGDKFTITRKDRTTHGGGVLLAANNNTTKNIVLSSQPTCGESISSEIVLTNRLKFNLISVYRPPNYGRTDLDSLSELVENDSNLPSIVIGDLNLPSIQWSSGNGCLKADSPNSAFHQRALNLIKANNMKQLISEPTHVKSNTLDLLLVDKILLDDITVKYTILPNISDHNPILVNICCQGFTKSNQDFKHTKLNFKKANQDAISDIFLTLHQKIKNTPPLKAEQVWHDFKESIDLSKTHIPILSYNPKNKQWITHKILRMIRLRNRAYQTFKKFPTEDNLSKEKTIGREVKLEIAKAKREYLEKHITNELKIGNTKPLFRHISNSRGHSNQISCLEGSTRDNIPEKLAEYFSSVYADKDKPTDLPEVVTKLCTSEMDDIYVNKLGLTKLIQDMDRRKAPGPDGISAYLLQYLTKNIKNFLDCFIIVLNLALRDSFVPNEWKVANICPIFKGGKRNLPSNYRPISLTSLVSKICEHIITSAMWLHIDQYNLLKDTQHGFRKSYNTTTQLIHVIHSANQALDKKEKFHLVSFDFAKAFDKVPHGRLIHKLEHFNFNNRTILWIKNWLHERVSAVTVNGLRSKWFPVNSGVPQGSVLGPLLFLVYINDMADVVAYSECRLYADDTVLCYNETTQGQHNLQYDVTAMQSWAKKWGMSFNVSKCAHMYIGNQNTNIKSILLNDEPIPKTDNLKYLGIHIQSNLKWHTQILHVSKKSNKILGLLKRSLHEAPPRTKEIAFNAVVRPILEYACPVWSPYLKCHIADLDRIHRNFMRWCFKIGKYDSVTDQMLINDTSSLADRRDTIDTLFLRKIEFGVYGLSLNKYINLNQHNSVTRGNTINPHYNTIQYQNCYFNRVRKQVKVTTFYSPDSE